MLDILDSEDDAKSKNRGDGAPETKVFEPYFRVVFDLESGLEGGYNDEGTDEGLYYPRSAGQSLWSRIRTTYQLSIKVPILSHGLRCATPEEIC